MIKETVSFYFCYDERLAKFLSNYKKIKYVTKAHDSKTFKLFHLFIQSDELQQGISEYKQLSLK